MNFYKHYLGDFTSDIKRHKLPVVYLLETVDSGFIKVGKSNSLKQRIINIQSGCPYELFILATIRTPKSSEIETFIHSALAHCLVRGEWFKPSISDLDYLLSFFMETNKHISEIHEKAMESLKSRRAP